MTTTEKKTKKPKSATASGGVRPKAPKTAAAKIPKAPRVKVPKVVVKKGKIVKKESEENKIILRIRVRAYESKILDSSVKQIMDTATRHDAIIVGPVPLPTEIKKYTVNRSPFIYKNTREQFEIRVHKRLIDIINPNGKTIEALTNLSLPSGVDIDVKMM